MQSLLLTMNRQSWPVSHVFDNSTLYVQILRGILEGNNIGCNENGYCLASSGAVKWLDVYAAFAEALANRGVVDTAKVGDVSQESLEKAAQALDRPKEMVPFSIGGQ